MLTYLAVKCHYVCKLLSRASTKKKSVGGGQGKERERKTNMAKRRQSVSLHKGYRIFTALPFNFCRLEHFSKKLEKNLEER